MPDDPALDKLRDRIEKAKKETQVPSSINEKPLNKMGKFFNIGIELVAGVVVGVGCGLVIDWAFGIAPWGLITLFILGSIAGMRNVYRLLTFKEKTDTTKDHHV
jgi:ATP synthase protein I